MMDAVLRKILFLILSLNRQVYTKIMDYSKLQKQALPMDECVMIVVSSSVIEEGKIMTVMISD